ncbi:MAG: transglutaminase family protein [Alphaproteobacteria bacterium]
MLLKVDHVTVYTYDRAARGIVQSNRLTPSVFEGQRTVSWDVTVTDGNRGSVFRDGAGDWIEAWVVKGPVAQIEVRVAGLVQTHDLAGVLRGHREMVPPEAYLRESPATQMDAALAKLAKVADSAPDRLSAAHGLMQAVADRVAYRPGTTHAKTTAAEALAQGEGVCQDHTHVLSAVARAAGIPARYVSGYLLADGEGQAHEAAHAWTELHLPGLGWVGFDAANRCCPDDRYIRLGSGMDAQGAAPIRGSARSRGEERLTVQVAVQSVQQ